MDSYVSVCDAHLIFCCAGLSCATALICLGQDTTCSSHFTFLVLVPPWPDSALTLGAGALTPFCSFVQVLFIAFADVFKAQEIIHHHQVIFPLLLDSI